MEIDAYAQIGMLLVFMLFTNEFGPDSALSVFCLTMDVAMGALTQRGAKL